MDWRYADRGYFFTGEFDYSPIERVCDDVVWRFQTITAREFWEKDIKQHKDGNNK